MRNKIALNACNFPQCVYVVVAATRAPVLLRCMARHMRCDRRSAVGGCHRSCLRASVTGRQPPRSTQTVRRLPHVLINPACCGRVCCCCQLDGPTRGRKCCRGTLLSIQPRLINAQVLRQEPDRPLPISSRTTPSVSRPVLSPPSPLFRLQSTTVDATARHEP